ncbi:FxSxx-COOH system tetratricopeptide repeat protein [Pseudofrankia inefficax]|uniref:FxSxx-COOH system tetratricopeptide repeat protein n=1 Tax=Pseudofrankia inefficax (strain DSM 45817 / CECT 9037 / DDB 130130 / EuI1c) TaxID=298654 RepID=UPI0002D612A4|nr:FxSxx-COOH system tetratricopeptide repeat protein [Pseudofrankia inefficax]
MKAGLTGEQIAALADVFTDPGSARQVVREAGIPAGDLPWTTASPRVFWTAVATLLADGIVAGGPERLLTLAREQYPAHPVFAGTTGQSSGRAGTGAVWEVGWPRNPLFTGRDAELAVLRAELVGSGAAAVLPVALHGLGGVGKTQMAAEYCYRFGREYDLVWWVAAEEPATTLAGLVWLAERIGVAVAGAAEESVRALVALLGSGTRFARWLLVLDNAGAPGDLFGLLRAASASGGHVLVTSRDHRWSGVAQSVRVDVLPSMDAVALLRARVPGIGDRDAARIAESLGNLPLAVEQAGAFLAETSMRPGEYAGLLSTELQQLMSRGAPEGVRPVAATWTVTLHQLEDPTAVMLARLWAHFGPEPIPLDLVRPQVAVLLPAPLDRASADRIGWAETVGRLLALALVRRTDDNDAVVMHRLAGAVLREDTPADLRPVLRTAARRLLAHGRPDAWDRPDAWPRFALLYAHASAVELVDDDDPDSRAMISRLTRYLLSRGDLPSSRALAERALSRNREILGEDHPDTLTSAANLASTLGELGQGDYAAARELAEDVLARRRQVLGEDHPDTLTAMADLAVTLRSLGDYAAARGLAQDVLARRREVLGEDHPDTLTAGAGLAATLRELRDYSAARALEENVLARRREVLGEDHPEVLTAAGNLAATLGELGDWSAARRLAEVVLARRREILGENHPDTLYAAGNLAVILWAMGGYAAARELEEGVLARRREILGENHPHTLRAAGNLAVTLWSTGHYAAARRLGEATLARSREVVGSGHPITLVVAMHLATAVRSRTMKRTSAIVLGLYACACLFLQAVSINPAEKTAGLLVSILLVWPRGDHWGLLPALGRVFLGIPAFLLAERYLSSSFVSGLYLGFIFVWLTETFGIILGQLRSYAVYRQYPGSRTIGKSRVRWWK